MKKGQDVLEKTGNLILLAIGLVILAILIYYFRDKIKDLIGVVLDVLK